jgi:hypothetical protein
MFLGHYGLALAATRVTPRTSLGTLIFAAQFLDLLWPALLLLGLEQVRIVPGLMAMSALDFVSYPISHSLATTVGWAVLIGGAAFLLRRDGRAALVLGTLVASHWLLDAPMHRPDLPLWPGSELRVGGGLWDSVAATWALEVGLYACGIAIYVRGTRARDRIGRWGLWAMLALLAVFFAGAGAPPPSERMLAVMALALWLFVPWAAWVSRHRTPAHDDPLPQVNPVAEAPRADPAA